MNCWDPFVSLCYLKIESVGDQAMALTFARFYGREKGLKISLPFVLLLIFIIFFNPMCSQRQGF